MAIVMTDDQNYVNIANAIRAMASSSDTYKPSEMATAINNLKTAKVVEITMTQSCTHGGGAIAIIDSIRDENATISVLVYNGSTPVDRQLGVLVTLLIEGSRWYCSMRKVGDNYITVAVEGGWDNVINIGDDYILYEI